MTAQEVNLAGRTVKLVRRYEDVIDRVMELKHTRDQVLPDMHRTAQMMDGGKRAVQAMLGDVDDDTMRDMPIANYMRDAGEAFAQRLGAVPDLRVDAPTTGRRSDQSDRAQKAAEKRARIVAHYDDDQNDELAKRIAELARWVPGAGFAVLTVDPAWRNGLPYPKGTLLSPLDTMLSQWAPSREPQDCGFTTTVQLRELINRYPEHADTLRKLKEPHHTGGGVLLGQQADSQGLEYVTYYDRHGTWYLLPELRLLLDFVPNPLESGPAFVAVTKFNYNRLRGEYDDMVGPMVSMARLQILSEVAVRKDVAQPTNLFTGAGGPLSGNYRQGFHATNIFDVNARVEIPQGSAQFQAWQQLDRLERTLRIEGTSPVQDSGESPMSFVTGRGLNALTERVERSVREYQKVFRSALQRFDAKRLEYDEQAWPNITKPMAGVRQGAQFSETYTPRTHIRGNYATRREYGAMASVDEAVRLNGLALMQQLGWTSAKWSRTQLDELGIPDSQMEQQIRAERAEQALDQLILTHATEPQSPEHLRMLRLLIEDLPPGRRRQLAEEMLASVEEAQQEQQQALMQAQGGGQPPPSEQEVLAALTQGADPTTLARLTQGGSPEGGTQVIAGGGR